MCPITDQQDLMAILKFRVYFEEDDSVYRDIAIRHTQHFSDLHTLILKSFEFDSKHQATFYRSNDLWLRGREITLEKYDKEYKAPPFLMKETAVASEIKDTNQRFVYVYDFAKNWLFHIELIKVDKEKSSDKGAKHHGHLSAYVFEGGSRDGYLHMWLERSESSRVSSTESKEQ